MLSKGVENRQRGKTRYGRISRRSKHFADHVVNGKTLRGPHQACGLYCLFRGTRGRPDLFDDDIMREQKRENGWNKLRATWGCATSHAVSLWIDKKK